MTAATMTTADGCAVHIGRLPPVGLAELVGIADLQTRRDRKYLVPPDVAVTVLGDLDARALDIDGLRTFRYESVYFDTAAWDSYLGAARRRPNRFKVRTRTYLDTGACVLEVKVRDRRGNTVKHRLPYDVSARDRLTPDGIAFVADVAASAPFAAGLAPTLVVTYRRSTLLLHDDSRVTLDRHAHWQRDGTHADLDDLVLVETKTTGRPNGVDRALWAAGHRPVTISKYCTGIAALDRTLPSNKWHRILQRHLLPQLVDH